MKGDPLGNFLLWKNCIGVQTGYIAFRPFSPDMFVCVCRIFILVKKLYHSFHCIYHKSGKRKILQHTPCIPFICSPSFHVRIKVLCSHPLALLSCTLRFECSIRVEFELQTTAWRDVGDEFMWK